MGVEPTPFRHDIVPALEEIKGAAQDIADAITGYIQLKGVPNDFVNALCFVMDSATRGVR